MLSKERQMSETINFYRTDDDYGCFSNFGALSDQARWAILAYDGALFSSRRSSRTSDIATRSEEANSPMLAARMGRDRKKKLRRDWESAKVNVMTDALRAKFTQHEELRAILLSTGDAKIVEHTENDDYWADGGDGSGEKHAWENPHASQGRPLRDGVPKPK